MSDTTTGSTTEQAKEQVSQVADQAKEQVGQVAGQAKGQFRDQLAQRSTQAGQQVNGHASDLKAVADSLREQGKDQPAKIAEQAADRAHRLGGYLENSSADRLLSDIEDYARRQPWTVGLAAAAAGFAASRFLKASSQQRYQGNGTTPRRAELPRTSSGTFSSGAVTGAPVSPPVQPTTPPTGGTRQGY